MTNNKIYSPSEASNILGLQPGLIRKYCDYFNVTTEWTKENNTGHRRFTKENIEELLEIKKLIQEDRMSWDNVRSFRNGEEDVFIETERKSKLEDKIDLLLEQQKRQDEFNKQLLIKLSEMSESIKKATESNLELRNSILLLEESSDEKSKEKTNWFSKLFK